MRYENWDVLLFPGGQDHKTPFKEFRVDCGVVPEMELLQHSEALGIPVMSCFVPSLDAGAHFQISVHSWTGPEISQATKSYSKHVDLVRFEARVLIDGELVSATLFDKEQVWPCLIRSTREITKSGELAQKRLKFPSFKKESLKTSHWNAGDDMGKIMVILSEGFPRDSVTTPFERVKNVVAFTFRYAPLEMLEKVGIAWPNPSMWRQLPLRSSRLPVPAYYAGDGFRSHAHSPRQQSSLRRPYTMVPSSDFASSVPQGPGTPFYGNPDFPPGLANVSRVPPGYGQFVSSDTLDYASYPNWMDQPAPSYANESGGLPTWLLTSAPTRHLERTSSDDTTQTNSSTDMMSEFSFQYPPNQRNGAPTPMHISGRSLEDEQPPVSMPVSNLDLRVPTSTTSTSGISMGNQYGSTQATAPPAIFPGGFVNPGASFLTPDFARSSSLANSLLNQPLSIPTSSRPSQQQQPQDSPLEASEMKPLHENRLFSRHTTNPASATSTPSRNRLTTRTVSQQLPNVASNTTRGITIFDASASPESEEALSGSASPPSAETTMFTSMVGSRSGSGSGLSSNIGNMRTGISTPMALRHTSASSLNSGELGSSGNRKRHRDGTSSSAKVVDLEDQQPRPSPHLRDLGYGMVHSENM